MANRTFSPSDEKPCCSLVGCERIARAGRDFCDYHQRNATQHGNPVAVKDRPMIARLIEIGWVETRRGCWEWSGARNYKGYAIITAKRRDGGRSRVHRIMYEMHNGPIPDGMVVRHKCDNPPCINPDHLEVGTPADNSRDMSERLRSMGYMTGRYDGVCRKGLHDVTSPGALREFTRPSGKTEVNCVQCDRDRKAAWARKSRAAA